MLNGIDNAHRHRRWIAALLVGVAVVAAITIVLARAAATHLHEHITSALGPRATLESAELSWRGNVELRGLRIAAERGWPAKDELRAARVRVSPDLRSLWSALVGGPWRVRRIEVEGGYLSLHRTRDGALRVVPALLGKPGAQSKASVAAAVIIGTLRLDAAAIDMYDSSVPGAGRHRVRLEQLDAEIGPLHLPALDATVEIDLGAVLKGPRHNGRLKASGTLTPATRDASLDIRAAGVDLVALQPYLLRVSEGGVKSGRLDLTMRATVRRMRLDAPGSVTLSDLELASGGGVIGTLTGAPRQAVLAAMKRDGRIEVKFRLDGRLDDPDFSVNENFATRIASGLAETLGVSIGGVVEGVGDVIKGLLGR